MWFALRTSTEVLGGKKGTQVEVDERARQRALGPPDAEALHAELVHHLTHQLDGTVRPVPTDYWDKQAYERRISRERFCLDRSGGIAHDSCFLRDLCKALDEARREQWLWSRGVHEKQIGTRWEYGSPEYLALKKQGGEGVEGFAAAGANLLPAT